MSSDPVLTCYVRLPYALTRQYLVAENSIAVLYIPQLPVFIHLFFVNPVMIDDVEPIRTSSKTILLKVKTISSTQAGNTDKQILQYENKIIIETKVFIHAIDILLSICFVVVVRCAGHW